MDMRHFKVFLFSLATTVLLASCGTSRTVPITGRTQNLMVSNEQVLSLSNQEYTNYMKTAKVSTDATNTAMVKRVGQKLATAVENYLRNNGMANEISEYKWEFNLVQDKQVNAFCMPGGKIVVYEGLLPVTKDESSLAIVLGHEIAHAVAKHAAEQMSTQIRQQYGAQAIGMVMSGAGASSSLQNIASTVIGIGAKGQNAKYSRNHESEADHLGIIFAAMAGYDPQVAVSFWQRMSDATGGGSTSWLSTHPSDATRIKQIQGWMPEALKYYQAAVPATTTTTKSAAKSTTSTNSTTKTLHIGSKKK